MAIKHPPGSVEMSRALGLMDRKAVRDLLERLAGFEIEVVREPRTGLVMQSVNDCFGTEFHIGEVLITEAEVRVDDQRGWAMVMGDSSDKAMLAACLDAISRSSGVELDPSIRDEISRWLALADKTKNDEAKLAATTRVNFESMAEEKPLSG